MHEVKIAVTVSPTGDTKIEAIGFKNDACLKETKSLEDALGKVEKRDLKAEGRIPEAQAGLTTKIGG
jgi:hypothetical protein